MDIRQHSKKLVLLGDTSVGKSCIVNRHMRGTFSVYQEPTIGAAFSTSRIDVGTHIINLEIWDTAGQERYKSLAPMYYRGASGAMVVFDITSKDSFEGAKSWIREIKNNGKANCIIYLVGNKSDLKELRKISTLEAKKYSEIIDVPYIEVSAKTGENINNLFHTVAVNIPITNRVNNDVERIVNIDKKNKNYCFSDFCSIL